MKRAFAILFLTTVLTAAFFASASPIKKKANNYFRLITAYTRQIAEPDQSNPPMEGHFFVIKWESAKLPEAFFWRGQGGWFTCDIAKAKKKGGSYEALPIDINQIHKGDLLMLTPLTGGRFAIPDEIPTTAKNTIYYKVGGSKWLAFPVKKISKK